MPAVMSLTENTTRRRSRTSGSLAGLLAAAGSGSSKGRSNSELMFQLFRGITQALDRSGLTGRFISSNQDAVQPRVAAGSFHAHGHPAQELVNHSVFFNTDDAVVRPRHSGIGQIRGTTWQNLLVGCLHMRVSSDNQHDFAVEMPPHGDFL